MTLRLRLLVLFFLMSSCITLGATPPPEHEHFRVAIYIPVFVVDKMKDPAWLQKSWDDISSQLKVDKVYIESYRSGDLADDALLQSVKKFFSGARRGCGGWNRVYGAGIEPVPVVLLHRPERPRICEARFRSDRAKLR